MSRRPALLLALLLAPLLGIECRVTGDPFLRRQVGDFALSWWFTSVTAEPGGARIDFVLYLANAGPSVAGVGVGLDALSPGSTVLDPVLDLGDVARGGVAEARFAVFQDAASPFDPTSLRFDFDFAVARDAAGFEIDPPGTWWEGDLHVHATGASNDTSPPGNSFPPDIAAQARATGLDFVVLTDHSNSTGSDPSTTAEDPALFNQGPEFPYWDAAAALSDADFLMLDGNEISPRHLTDIVPTGHVGCIPPEDPELLDRSGAFVDRPMGSVTGGETVAQARARGCFVVVNHPYTLPWISYDWTSDDYDAMEIWNGGIGLGMLSGDLVAHDAWRCDLLAGRSVTPLATSDNHRVYTPAPGNAGNPALGWPRTSVFAPALEWGAIVSALRRGHVALHGGASRLYLDGYDADGILAEGAAVRRLRLRGELDAAATASALRLVRVDACADGRPLVPPVVAETVLLEQTIAPGSSFDVEVAIADETGVYTAELLPDEPLPLLTYYAAFSRAIVVE